MFNYVFSFPLIKTLALGKVVSYYNQVKWPTCVLSQFQDQPCTTLQSRHLILGHIITLLFY